MSQDLLRTGAALLVLSLAFPGSATEQVEISSVAEHSAKSITEAEILEHIRYLSSDDMRGRASGSKEDRIAADYVAEAFGEIGLLPAGDGESYLQAFEFARGVKYSLGEGNQVEARIGESLVSLTPNDDFRPFPDSAPAKGLEGEVIFAGYGILDRDLKFDEYAGVDASGKIVILLRRTPEDARSGGLFKGASRRLGSFRRKVDTAKKAGAKAVLLCNNSTSESKADQIPSLRFLRGTGETDIPMFFVARSFVQDVLESIGKDLQECQDAIDESSEPRSFEIPGVHIRLVSEIKKESPPKGKTQNVIGMLRGRDEKLAEEIVVVGGHYDHVGLGEFGSLSTKREIHNGADDNASGTAGIIEIAQAFSELEMRPRRSILFIAFGAEERGLLGAKAFIEKESVPLKNIVAMLNFDMIGRSENRHLGVQGTGTSPAFADLLPRLNDLAGVQLSLKAEKKVGSASDHVPFSQEEIPTLFFHTGLHRDYHRPGDDWEKIAGDEAARTTRLGFLTAYDLANREERPVFTKVEREGIGARVRRFFGADDESKRGFLGVSPLSLEDDVDGCTIQVSEGGPAELAGLFTGDVIVMVGGKDVKNFEELATLIRERKAGDEVEITIRRKIKVKLGG